MKCLLATLTAAVLLASMPGCKSVQWSKKPWNPLAKVVGTSDSEFGSPTQMALFWKDAVYEKPGIKSTRGFGARLFFYDKHSEPVKADGELIVYGYDDSSQPNGSAAADRKYVFPRDEFQKHYSKTELGHSYSIWIPWDKVGGYRKTITLVPVFKTSDGRLLKTGQMINVLPGKTPDEQHAGREDTHFQATPDSRDRSVISQTAFQGNENTGAAHAAHTVSTGEFDSTRVTSSGHQTDIRTSRPPITATRTTTIAVPQDMARRMANLPPQNLPFNQFNRVKISTEDLTSRPVMGRKRNQRQREDNANANQSLSQSPQHPIDRFEEAKKAALPAVRPVFGQPGSFR